MVRQVVTVIRYICSAEYTTSLLTDHLNMEIWDAEAPQKYGEHDIFSRAMREHLFKNAYDLGAQYHMMFNPLPLPTLALLFTIVSQPFVHRLLLILTIIGRVLHRRMELRRLQIRYYEREGLWVKV